MISIIRKIIADDTDRLWFASFIVIAANSGGAWSPIGDITTTMLWIENKVSSLSLIKNLFIPSIISIAIPVLIVAQFNRFRSRKLKLAHQSNRISATALFYLFLGIGLFIAVPILKMLTGLPPYLCIMGTMGVMWLISEIENPLLFPATTKTSRPTVQQALSRIEMPGILFFFGILLAVAALQFVGHLENLRTALDNQFENPAVIAFFLGIISSVIDNVPLVAGAIGMYDFEIDHSFWHQLAFAAGTGGSLLIIGSAAGVAAMSLEKITYSWYFKNISWLALLGYLGAWLYMYYI